MAEVTEATSVELATELTIAWLSNANTRAAADDVPVFLARMHVAVQALGANGAADKGDPVREEGAVSVRKSLASKDHIISMLDGKPYKTLRRHLTGHGLTPDQYRERFGLKPDYPMVSESYSRKRSDMAKALGLGRKASDARAKRTGKR